MSLWWQRGRAAELVHAKKKQSGACPNLFGVRPKQGCGTDINTTTTEDLERLDTLRSVMF